MCAEPRRIPGARHATAATPLLPDPAKHGVTFSDMAFFPLFPMLMRTLTTLLPISAVTAGLVVAWAAAGALALPAGASRPSGIAVAAAVRWRWR